MPSERTIDEGPYGNLPATGAGTTTFGAVDGGDYHQPPTDPVPPGGREAAHAPADDGVSDGDGASGSPGREASGSTSGLPDGRSDDFDPTAGGTVSALAVSDDASGTDAAEAVAGTPNTDRADEQRLPGPSGASTPETPGF